MSNHDRMTSSIESLNTKLTISPQATITEGVEAGTASSPLLSPTLEYQNPLSRNASVTSTARRGGTRAARIPNIGPRRNSARRSLSQNPSVSPAHAFLSSWGTQNASNEPPPEPSPDDEGQSIGLSNEYIIGRTLNSGGFGTIKELHSLAPNTGVRILRAVKVVRKTVAEKDERENERCQEELQHEVSVWKYLRHRHILALHVVYDTDFATFCVMDLNSGGTLYDLLHSSRKGAAENGGRKGLDPVLAKRYAHQLASALRYLHEDIRVCHRDVKLENCLIDMSGPDAAIRGGNLRLCDFGLADFLHSESISLDSAADAERQQDLEALDALVLPQSASPRRHRPTTSSVIGTLEYASPKGLSVTRKLFETAGDVWAFGVVVYALCTGELPFRHAMPAKTVELILQADWDIEALRSAANTGTETPGGTGSAEVVIELMRGCLEMDIDLRLTIGEVLRSHWFFDEESRSGSEDEAGRW